MVRKDLIVVGITVRVVFGGSGREQFSEQSDDFGNVYAVFLR